MRIKSMTKIMVLLVIGMAGSILFFPMRINEQRSCLMDSFVNAGTSAEFHADHDHTGMEVMAQKYIFPYGLLWWLSVAITYFSIRSLTKRKIHAGRHGLIGSSILFWLWLSLSLHSGLTILD